LKEILLRDNNERTQEITSIGKELYNGFVQPKAVDALSSILTIKFQKLTK